MYKNTEIHAAFYLEYLRNVVCISCKQSPQGSVEKKQTESPSEYSATWAVLFIRTL